MSAAKLAICLLAATAVDAYLRKGGKSEQSRPDSRRLDEDCADDPEWYHKNRGPDYDCAWVALKTDTCCAVKGISLCGNSTECGSRRDDSARRSVKI